MNIVLMVWALAPAFFFAAGATAPGNDSTLQAGTVTEFTLPSAIYARQRKVWVYEPTGYPGVCGEGCPLIVAFDGSEYTTDMPLPAMLDSLIAARAIQPSIALLIDDGSGAERVADLANRDQFARYVGEELLPWLRGKWRVTHDAARTIVTGSSAGGLAAAYLSFRRPDLFGNVLSQSGAFWRGSEGSNDAPYEWLTAQYAAAARKPIRFLLDVGSTETRGAVGGSAPSILDANRRLRDVLRKKGYALDYYEVPNGFHAPASWRPRLPTGIVALSGY